MGGARWVTLAVASAGAMAGVLANRVLAEPVPTYSKVAETNDHAPGTPAAVTYSAVQTPLTDGTGKFLFVSQLANGGLTAGLQDSGIFHGARGALQLVARAGQEAPGAGGAVWSDLLHVGPIVRPGGRLAFAGEVDGADSAHDGGIWAGTPGTLQLVAREGDAAPGTTVVFAGGNRSFQDALHLAMNDAGTIALRAKLAGTGVTTGNDTALFVGAPDALSLVARLGSAAPGAGGATFAKSGGETFSSPSINASGKIAFRGHLTGTGVTPANADAFWFGDPADLEIAVRSGQTVEIADIPPSSTFLGLGAQPPVINDAGQLLFEAPVFDGLTFTFTQGVWLGAPQPTAHLALAGEAAPGDSQGATFAGLFQHLRLNGSGQAAFHALLSSGLSDYGLFMWDGAALHEVWRTGDQAPGMPEGEKFGTTATDDMFLNASGKVLFRAITTPGSITGVWLADPAADTVTLLARTDALADVTVDGAQEKIIDLILAGGIDTAGSPQDGRSSPLGDDGKFAILAQFLDGHLAVLTNAAGSGGGGSTGSVTPTSIALGSTIDVTGSGFGGGAARFRAPKAWLTVGTDPRKIPLRVDAKSATDAALHLTLASLRKGAHGPATLHIRPRPRQAAEITADVTIELPAVESLSAPSGQGGDTLTLSGSWFGTKKRKARFVATIGERVVKKTLTVKSWAAGSIVVLVPKRVIPTGAPSLDGTIEVQSDAGVSNTTAFTILR